MSAQYSKLFAALSGVAVIFIQTQWPTGKYTAACLAAIAALLVYLVPNVPAAPVQAEHPRHAAPEPTAEEARYTA